MSADRISSKARLVRPAFDAWTTAARLDRVMLTLLVASLFLERWDKDYYFDGRSPIPDPFFVVFAGAVAAHLLVRNDAREVVRAKPAGTELTLTALVLLLGVLSIFGLAFGPLGFARLPQIVKTFTHLAYFLVVALVLGRTLTPVLVAFTLRAYLALATLFAGVAILQAVDVNALHTGLSEKLTLGTRHNHGFEAPLSIYSEPANLGYACLTAVLIGLFLDVRHSKATQSAVVICAVGLMLSLSAGAVAIAGLLALLLLAVAGRHLERRTLLGIAVAACVVVAIAAATPVGGAAADRASGIVTGSDPSAQYRRAVDKGAVRVWEESPVFGVGLGDTRYLLAKHVHLSFIPDLNAQFVDSSTYLQLLAETGPLGVAAFVVALGALLRRGRRGGRLDDLTRVLVLLTALECLVIAPFIRPWFWFAAGLRLAMLAVPDTRHPEKAPGSPEAVTAT